MRRLVVASVASVVTAMVAMVAVALVGVPGTPVAGPAPAAAQGCSPRLSVSKTVGLAPSGETVTVTGSCFDVSKGVYVAFCVVPPPGAVPSPCGGGVDMAGANGVSHWISSNPPPQGAGLTTPYGPGGTFTVSMRPSSQLNATVDCRRVSCAVVTRNDHTRASDRSQDVIVPVSFAADPAPAVRAPPTTSPALPPVAAEAPPAGAPDEGEVVAEEASSTTVPDTSTTTSSTLPSDDDDGRAAEEELAAAAPASAGGGGAGPGVAVAAGAVVLLLLAVGGGWWAQRRRGAGADGGAP